MSKSTRALSGAAKDTFLEGVVNSALGEDHAARERLLRDLTDAIASLRVRVDADRGRRAISEWTNRVLSAADAVRIEAPQVAAPSDAKAKDGPPTAHATAPMDAPFDPYDPNVIVVLRTGGREAILAALSRISDEKNLRVLAHEQQLSIPAEATGLPAIRDAIVAAAERRIANRRAAGR